MIKTDCVIIGGGPCGMAAAITASENGSQVILIERDDRLGGILTQCIHNGFGLHKFGEELTGPEYADKWKEKLKKCKNVITFLGSMVTDICKNDKDEFLVTFSNSNGIEEVICKSVVVTIGCRERPAGAINLCGSRPAGIFTAGCAQRLINIEGKKVGNTAVILGSGDIGLIMARRFICEGGKVQGVYEIMPNSGGLARNITQCLRDFDIPLYLSTTITRVVGKNRVEGVYVAPVDQKMKPIKELEKFVPCDTVLLSVGLIPETELLSKFNLEFNNVTNSFTVDEYFQTGEDGLFCAGNVLHVNDLVDNVSNEGEKAGKYASMYAQNKLKIGDRIQITHDSHIKYTAPKYIYPNSGLVSISFRVDKNYQKVIVVAQSNGVGLSKRPLPAVTAGEMQTIEIDTAKIKSGLHLDIKIL